MVRITVHEKAEYLSDIVLAATDGIVTTFSVVAGSAGAALSTRVVLILGFANLFADGFSMAVGNYLGIKSEIEYEKAKKKENVKEGVPFFHGLITFLFFNVAGFIPLIPFIFSISNPFIISGVLVGISLFAIGLLRGIYTKRNFLKSGLEIFVIGGLAAFVAFFAGFLINKYIV